MPGKAGPRDLLKVGLTLWLTSPCLLTQPRFRPPRRCAWWWWWWHVHPALIRRVVVIWLETRWSCRNPEYRMWADRTGWRWRRGTPRCCSFLLKQTMKHVWGEGGGVTVWLHIHPVMTQEAAILAYTLWKTATSVLACRPEVDVWSVVLSLPIQSFFFFSFFFLLLFLPSHLSIFLKLFFSRLKLSWESTVNTFPAVYLYKSGQRQNASTLI